MLFQHNRQLYALMFIRNETHAVHHSGHFPSDLLRLTTYDNFPATRQLTPREGHINYPLPFLGAITRIPTASKNNNRRPVSNHSSGDKVATPLTHLKPLVFHFHWLKRHSSSKVETWVVPLLPYKIPRCTQESNRVSHNGKRTGGVVLSNNRKDTCETGPSAAGVREEGRVGLWGGTGIKRPTNANIVLKWRLNDVHCQVGPSITGQITKKRWNK